MAVHCILRTVPCPLQDLVFAHLFKVTAEALLSGGNSEAKTACKHHRQAYSCAWPSSWRRTQKPKIVPRASVCTQLIHIDPPHVMWPAGSGSILLHDLTVQRNGVLASVHFVRHLRVNAIYSDCRPGKTVVSGLLAHDFFLVFLSDQQTDPGPSHWVILRKDEEGMCGPCAEKTVKHDPYHPCMVYLPSDVFDLYAFHVGK